MTDKILSIDDISRHIKGIKVYEMPKDSELIKIFEEEQRRLGLSGITLLVPEVPKGEKYHSWFASCCYLNGGEYEVKLKVPIDENAMSGFLRVMLNLEFPGVSHLERIRKLVRHELMHIRLDHVGEDWGIFNPHTTSTQIFKLTDS